MVRDWGLPDDEQTKPKRRKKRSGTTPAPEQTETTVIKRTDADINREIVEEGKAEREHDPIDRPAHYLQSKIEPVVFIEQADLGWCSGNVVKYLVRFKHKNGLEDLKKAKAYIEMMIDNYKEWYE